MLYKGYVFEVKPRGFGSALTVTSPIGNRAQFCRPFKGAYQRDVLPPFDYEEEIGKNDQVTALADKIIARFEDGKVQIDNRNETLRKLNHIGSPIPSIS